MIDPSRPAILCVCLGNICRSPLAEAALREAATQTGLDLTVDSAGTGAWHVGDPPDARAQAVARRHGIDISGARARQVVAEDFARFTHILALDRDNFGVLARMAPAGATAELAMLMDAVPGREGTDVADPYYGEAAGFETTWADVRVAAEAWIARLTA